MSQILGVRGTLRIFSLAEKSLQWTIESLHADIPEKFNIFVRENHRVNLQSVNGEIFRVEILDQ